MKGATIRPCVPFSGLWYFNPRTHEGCDVVVMGRFTTNSYISIHAPMKGATEQIKALFDAEKISIHAPMKGATVSGVLINRFKGISIHAPMKGATGNGAWFNGDDSISIHAPMKGATAIMYHNDYTVLVFQSTHP